MAISHFLGNWACLLCNESELLVTNQACVEMLENNGPTNIGPILLIINLHKLDNLNFISVVMLNIFKVKVVFSAKEYWLDMTPPLWMATHHL